MINKYLVFTHDIIRIQIGIIKINDYNMNYTSISKIRNRIISIIDLILIQYEQSDSNIYGINETKL